MKSFGQITTEIRTALGLVVLGALLMATPASAQYSPTGKDGITASPRLRKQLDEGRTRFTNAATRSPMACEKCKDTWVSQKVTETKGVGSRVMTGDSIKRVSKHLCDGCQTDWKVVGSGKSKHLASTHTCSERGSSNMACCTGARLTKGMKPGRGVPAK